MIKSNELIKRIEKAQIDEEVGVTVYSFMANREKHENNKTTLENMSKDEKDHANIWKEITKKDLKPKFFTVFFLKLLTVLLGFTFVIKIMQKAEQISQKEYEELQEELPSIAKILDDERRHEKELAGMLDEEKLHYVGAIVLGLNDALVELTGALSGVTFALANNRLIAMTGIITGISATLSMAASNYLAQRENGGMHAMKSSLYTGVAYLITVVLMVLPYLILPSKDYVPAFIMMIITVILIILFFNYYISVAKGEKFFKNFIEMFIISSSVAVISFVIGILAKTFLGVEEV